MAATPITPIKLSPSDLEGLDALRLRYGLPTRAATVRRLIADALADQRGGMPSAGQIATLMDRLTAAVHDPRFQ
jgi:hypothetical protein